MSNISNLSNLYNIPTYLSNHEPDSFRGLPPHRRRSTWLEFFSAIFPFRHLYNTSMYGPRTVFLYGRGWRDLSQNADRCPVANHRMLAMSSPLTAPPICQKLSLASQDNPQELGKLFAARGTFWVFWDFSYSSLIYREREKPWRWQCHVAAIASTLPMGSTIHYQDDSSFPGDRVPWDRGKESNINIMTYVFPGCLEAALA